MNIKKILKNKKNLIIIFILDIFIFTIITLVSNNKCLVVISYLILHILLLLIMMKFLLNINLLNFNKIKNMIMSSRLKRNLLKDDEYLKKIRIDTFDGSGSLTHPSILYFEKKFNGFKYWMVYTPYDNNNVELENPCIAVSNDGINYNKPIDSINPLLPIIKKKKPNTFYNDPFLLYNNRLEIWYRYTIEDKKLINHVYRITSQDGIHWSDPELMIENDGRCYMSLSIIKIADYYVMYYFDMNNKFNMIKSKDLYSWSNPQQVEIENFTGKYWHGEVKYIDDNIVVLFMDNKYNLYIASYENDIKFKKLKKFKNYYYPRNYLYSDSMLYKSTITKVKENIYIYIPFKINKLRLFRISNAIHKKWELRLVKINQKNLNKIFEEKEGLK